MSLDFIVVQSRGPWGPKRVTLGRHGELSCEEARKQATFVIDRIKRGEEPEPGPPEVELAVADLAERFMRDHVKTRCKPDTARTYRSLIENRVEPALGGTAVAQVGRAEVAALHHGLRGTPAVANAALGLLSKMFKMAEAWDVVPAGSNPCRGLRRYRTRKRERFLTQDEFRRLGRALRNLEAEGRTWAAAVAAIRLLMLTGRRKSEILTLRWEEVALDQAEMRLADSKTGARVVSLSEAAVKLLSGLPHTPGHP